MAQNIDNYFKEKLQHREFKLKDAYWQEAAALLAATEKKKRRGLFFWWTGGLMAAVALTTWFFLQNSAATSVTKISNSQPDRISETITNETKDSAPSEDRISLAEKKDVKTGDHSLYLNNSGQNEISKDNETTILTNAANTGTATFHEEEIASTTPHDSQPNTTEKSFTKEESIIPVESVQRFATPDALANLLNLIEGNFSEEPGFTIKETNGCFQPSPFHFGVSAAQLMQAAPKSGENLITGFYGGVVLQYDLTRNWFLSSGLGYLRRDGHFEVSKMTETRNYRFGLEMTEDQLRPTSLHYVSMPVLAGWKKGHHLVEAGILLDYLAGVQGEKGQLERVDSDQPSKEFVAKDKGWISEEGFTRSNLSPTVGYRYRVNKELSFGLSAQYALQPLTKEPKMGEYLLQENDRLNIRLQAVYLLK